MIWYEFVLFGLAPMCLPRGHVTPKFKPALVHISNILITYDSDLMFKVDILYWG